MMLDERDDTGLTALSPVTWIFLKRFPSGYPSWQAVPPIALEDFLHVEASPNLFYSNLQNYNLLIMLMKFLRFIDFLSTSI